MALISFLPSTPNTSHSHENKKKKKKTILHPPPPPPPPRHHRQEDIVKSSSPWEQFMGLLSCKNTASTVEPSIRRTSRSRKSTRLGSTCGSSMCAIHGAVQGSTSRVTDHGSSSDSGSHNEGTPRSACLGRPTRTSQPPPPPPPSRGGMQLMKLSGCYECHAVDVNSVSRRYSRPRTLCPCAECGEVFTKSESLEHHQAIRHAVSELGPDDSSRNVVEIIFKSSWQRGNKQANRRPAVCSIERILKVHNTPRTISRFEDHRAAVISRCSASSAGTRRCAADGNELLRFHSAPVACPLGAGGSTSLCLNGHDPGRVPPPCGVCAVVRHGFSKAAGQPRPVRTAASSGGAHEGVGGRRAMLVCRVIAGRVKRKGDDGGAVGPSMPYDSVAGEEGDLEELFVDNPRAILPCFVVLYKT